MADGARLLNWMATKDDAYPKIRPDWSLYKRRHFLLIDGKRLHKRPWKRHFFIFGGSISVKPVYSDMAFQGGVTFAVA